MRAWSENDFIWTFLTKENKVQNTPLMSIAQDKYFYEIEEISNEDRQVIINLIEQHKDPSIKVTNYNLLSLCDSIKEENLKGKLTEDKITIINTFRKAFIDVYQGQIERFGFPLIQCESFDEFVEYSLDKDFTNMVLFLNTQYLRTRKMKMAFVGENKTQFQKTLNKHWNIVSVILSNNASMTTASDRNLKFKFISNHTDTDFITSDQPAINLVKDILFEDGTPMDLELYYPISSRNAIILYFSSLQSQKIINVDADKEYICILNNKMKDNADLFIFSKTQEQLRPLVTSGI